MDPDPDPYWSPTSTSGSGSGKNEYGSTTLLNRYRYQWIHLTKKHLQFMCCGSGSGIGRFFDHWIRDPDPGMNIPDLIFETLLIGFWVKKYLKFFGADPDSGSQPWIQDLGWKSDPGSLDKDSRTTTLVILSQFFTCRVGGWTLILVLWLFFCHS